MLFPSRFEHLKNRGNVSGVETLILPNKHSFLLSTQSVTQHTFFSTCWAKPSPVLIGCWVEFAHKSCQSKEVHLLSIKKSGQLKNKHADIFSKPCRVTWGKKTSKSAGTARSVRKDDEVTSIQFATSPNVPKGTHSNVIISLFWKRIVENSTKARIIYQSKWFQNQAHLTNSVFNF